MLLLNRYSYDPQSDFVADGGNAKVYKAFDTWHDNLPVLIKFYYRVGTHLFRSNMEHIKGLQHPNLVALYDYVEIESVNAFGQTDTLRVGIWEYVATTPQDLSAISATDTENAVRSLLSALQYLHQHQCAHLDLSRQNVLLSTDNQLKLNNYEITRNSNNTSAAADQSSDLRALGQVLYELFGGTSTPYLSATGELNIILPDHVREVYGAIIRKCHVAGSESGVQTTEELTNLLDYYDRNKRFDAVVALNEDQFVSRYTFDPDTHKIAQTDQSLSYKAHDNLLDTEVSLEIFMIDTQQHGANLLATLTLSQYAHLFKVNLSNEAGNYQGALVGIAQQQVAKLDNQEHVVTNNDTPIEGDAMSDIAKETPAAAESVSETTQTQETVVAFSEDTENIVAGAVEHTEQTIAVNNDLALGAELHDIQFTEAIGTTSHVERDSTGIQVEMIDDNLARELAALDSDTINSALPEYEQISQSEPEVSDDTFRTEVETDQNTEETVDNSPATATINNDDDDFVHIDTPATREEETIKGTEMIQHEAIEQVLRDMERLLKG